MSNNNEMNIDFLKEDTGQEILKALGLIKTYTEIYLKGWDLSSWKAAGAIIDGGNADEVFSVADACNVSENNVDALYDVLGIDEEVPTGPKARHVLSIIRRYVWNNLPFDPAQYLFAVTEEACDHYGWPKTGADAGMPAGTYHVTGDHIANNNSTAADTSYQFTTTKVIPIGGGIRHSTLGSKNTIEENVAGVFSTYTADRYTILENNLVTTEGTGGTNLGTATLRDPQYKSGAFINFGERQMWGSNRWSTSWARQVLNCNDAVVSFVPGTIFSRPASLNQVGFMSLLDEDIKSVMGKVRKRYALSIADGYGYEDVEDYVTLETMLDIYGQNNNNIYEGPVTASGEVKRTVAHSLYKDVLTTNADKIKTNAAGAAQLWWLSSSYPSVAYYERVVLTSGALSGSLAFNGLGWAPVLHITGERKTTEEEDDQDAA